jgi:tetratricopeptide (TPR) repeat protein
MLKDKQGNNINSVSTEAVEFLNSALHSLNIYRGDPFSLAEQALAADPDCGMAHLFKAHLLALSTEPAATAAAAELLNTLSPLPLSEREASHLAALKHCIAGNWTAAGLAFERHTELWPHDLLAIQAGHLTDFYRADARCLRDRIARVLPRWSRGIPGYSYLLGMYAFGLEEAGDYSRAEAFGREALTLDPLDCWAHHAVAHVMEMQGRAEDGIGWMTAREPFWSGADNFFRIHNAWHGALCHLTLGETARVLALYDGTIRGGRSSVALNLIDASALLWRLELAGADIGDRWQELADCWDQQSDGRTYGFNDWHAAMAWLGAGQFSKVEALTAALRQQEGAAGETAGWNRHIALPLIEGFAAFRQGHYGTACDLLAANRRIVNAFGGSHAQRDITDLTLTEAALRSGRTETALALSSERLALRPASPVNLALMRRAAA